MARKKKQAEAVDEHPAQETATEAAPDIDQQRLDMSEGVLAAMQSDGVDVPRPSDETPPTPEPTEDQPTTQTAKEVPAETEPAPSGKPEQSVAEEGGEDDLKAEINALAEVAQIDPELMAGCRTVEEAEKVANAVLRHLAERASSTDERPEPPSKPAEPDAHQKTAEEELNLDDLDEDDPNRKYIEKLLKRQNALEKRIADSEKAATKRQEESVRRAQQQAAREFQQTLMRKNPEIFGTPDKQTWRQKRNFQKAYESGMILDRGAEVAGRPFDSYDDLADRVLRMDFGDEIAKTKQLAGANGRRTQRRLGAPARRATTKETVSDKEPPEDPRDDPELHELINSVLSDQRRE